MNTVKGMHQKRGGNNYFSVPPHTPVIFKYSIGLLLFYFIDTDGPTVFLMNPNSGAFHQKISEAFGHRAVFTGNSGSE